MPSRKQRRRRAKLQRHEYEYVIETEEGEVPVERLRDLEKRGRDNGSKTAAGPVDRRGRPIQKPTFERVLRRTAIFAPVLLLFVYLTSGNRLSYQGIILNTVVLIAFFIPFSYLVDTIVYRLVMRRYERDRAAKRGR